MFGSVGLWPVVFHRFGAVHDGRELLRGVGLTLSEHGPQNGRVSDHQRVADHQRVGLHFLAAQRRHARVAGVVTAAEHGVADRRRRHLQRGQRPHGHVAPAQPVVGQRRRRFPVVAVLAVERRRLVADARAVRRRVVVLVVVVDADGVVFGRARVPVRRHVVRGRRADYVAVLVGGGGGGRRALLRLIRVVVLHEAFDLQHLGDFQQRGQLVVRDVHLALIHVVEYRFHLGVADVFQDDRGVLAGHLGEHRLEIRRARGQHHLVAFHRRPALAEQRRVRELFGLEQLNEHVGQVRLVIVPSQTVLLVLSGDRIQMVVGHFARTDL